MWVASSLAGDNQLCKLGLIAKEDIKLSGCHEGFVLKRQV